MIGMSNHHPPPTAATQARLILSDAWYVRQPDGRVSEVRCQSFRPITDPDPQVYTRTLTLGPDWVEADLGFCAGRCGHLLLKNLGSPTPRSVQPTPEQRAYDESLLIEVGFGTSKQDIQLLKPSVHRTQWDTFETAATAALVEVRTADLVVYPQHTLRLPLHQERQTVHLRAPNGPVRLELTAVPR